MEVPFFMFFAGVYAGLTAIVLGIYAPLAAIQQPNIKRFVQLAAVSLPRIRIA